MNGTISIHDKKLPIKNLLKTLNCRPENMNLVLGKQGLLYSVAKRVLHLFNQISYH